MNQPSEPRLPLNKEPDSKFSQSKSAESRTIKRKTASPKSTKASIDIHDRLQCIGREFVDICHYIILFLISVVVVWSVGKEFFWLCKNAQRT